MHPASRGDIVEAQRLPRSRAHRFSHPFLSPPLLATPAELEEQLDEIDTLKYNLRHAHGPAEAWGEEASSSRSEHEQLADEPPPAMDKAAMARAYQAKSQSAGQGSYDSTMTAFEAEMATADMP